MKKTDCQFYGKGGWCGKRHDREIHVTQMGIMSLIKCVRCSELLRRGNGTCKFYTIKKGGAK